MMVCFKIEPETELPSIFPICRIIAECNMSWTLTPTGGDLIGHNGERFAIVFRGSPSLPFLHKNDLDRLRVHRKHCLRTKAVNSLMSLRDLTEKTQVDTSLEEGKDVCVAPARVFDSEESIDHENSGHERKEGNCVPCAAGCGRTRSHFRLDPTTRLGGCLSVDISGPHAPGVWPALDDSQFVATRKARYFLVAHHQTYTLKKLKPSSPEKEKQLSWRIVRATMVACARRSQPRVISLATRTSLMSLMIIQVEVSGSMHIR